MRVVLGLSGGVDSTAAALLLQQAGYQVTGLFFDVLGSQKALARRAKQAADQLGIPFLYRDVSGEFSGQIIDSFCQSYLNGETPNPCVLCNPTLKFPTLIQEADRIGAEYIATGHYARVLRDPEDGLHYVHMGENRRKDQSYMLYRLPQSVLSRLLLPLGGWEQKDQVRALLKEEGLSNWEERDSQEICFVSQGSYIDLIRDRGGCSPPGDFVDSEGRVLGRHQGIVHYTIGQRKGLGITFGKPVFVTAIDPIKNTVTLGSHQELFQRTVLADDCCFAVAPQVRNCLPAECSGKGVSAKIRYSAPPASAVLSAEGEGVVRVEFDQPQRAPTPGQSVVFYRGDRVLGGGILRRRDALRE